MPRPSSGRCTSSTPGDPARGYPQNRPSRQETSMRTVRQLLAAKAPEIHAIGPDAAVIDAIRLMAEKRIGALLVMEGARLVEIGRASCREGGGRRGVAGAWRKRSVVRRRRGGT